MFIALRLQRELRSVGAPCFAREHAPRTCRSYGAMSDNEYGVFEAINMLLLWSKTTAVSRYNS